MHVFATSQDEDTVEVAVSRAIKTKYLSKKNVGALNESGAHKEIFVFERWRGGPTTRQKSQRKKSTTPASAAPIEVFPNVPNGKGKATSPPKSEKKYVALRPRSFQRKDWV